MRASRARSGPTPKGMVATTRQKEHDSGQRPAAGADAELQIAEEEG